MNICADFCLLVGPSGLEPPTSCLSGTRSNLLSYDPSWLVFGVSLGLVEMMGFDSRRGLRVLVAVGSNSPPDCYSLPPLFESLNSYSQDLLLRCLLSHGGDDGIRTHDPLLAGQVLSQLSYTPILLGLLFFSVESRSLCSLTVLALSYLPGPRPAKYFHHCRA